MLVILKLVFILTYCAAEIPPETWMSPDQMAVLENHTCEVHKFQTSDGYKLTLYRLPCSNSKFEPIVFCPGFLSSAKDALLIKNKSFPYIFQYAGYDVWLLNLRTTEECTHMSKPKDGNEYWDFSTVENGKIDVAESIDYILGVTKAKKINYIGHSMGSTLLWIGCNERKDTQDKIRVHIAVNPAYGFSGFKVFANPLVKLGATSLLSMIPINHWSTPLKLKKSLVKTCLSESNFLSAWFINEMYKSRGLKTDERLVYLTANRDYAFSAKQVIYFLYCSAKGYLTKYDYGFYENSKIYGSFDAPKYDVTACKAPTVIYYGNNDNVITPQDIQSLLAALKGNTCEVSNLPEAKESNHYDFLLSEKLATPIYQDILKMLKKYS